MKFFLKISCLFIIGIITAVIVYPILHELSHSIMCIFWGAEIIEINMLPYPSVLCNVSDVDTIGTIVIGMSGMLLPYIFVNIIKVKFFWIWYATYIVKVISALAFVISNISSFCFLVGKPWPNDDTTQILMMWGDNKWIFLVILIILSIVAVFGLVSEKPLKKCFENFDMV